MPKENDPAPATPFGQAVKRVLDEHGLSARGARPRTGIPGSTISGWFRGIPPQPGNVILFARAFKLDEDEWLRLAGHGALAQPEHDSAGDSGGHTEGESYDQVLGRGMRELKERLEAEGLPLPTGLSSASGSKNLTPADAVQELEFYEHAIRTLYGGQAGAKSGGKG